jgi:hypothetical protein
MSRVGKAQRTAMRGRNSSEIRLAALTQQIRNIALAAPMEQGTWNRLHAVAHGIDALVEGLPGRDAAPAIRWTGGVPDDKHTAVDNLARIAKHYPPLSDGLPMLTQAQAAEILDRYQSARELVARYYWTQSRKEGQRNDDAAREFLTDTAGDSPSSPDHLVKP